MRLLNTQLAGLLKAIDTSRFRSTQFRLDDESIVRFNDAPTGDVFFAISIARNRSHNDCYELNIRPGFRRDRERHEVPLDFPRVLEVFNHWLDHLYAETAVLDRLSDREKPPAWLQAHLPAKQITLTGQIESLRVELTNVSRMVSLLWQTGHVLTEALVSLFRLTGIKAEATEPGATYDLTVTLDGGKRLLIEVTGIEGPIKKASPKFAQAFQALNEVAGEEDRVLIAVNAHRTIAPGDRPDLVTADALRMLTRLGVTVVPTLAFYRVWEAADAGDIAGAKRRLEGLHSAQAGILESF
jgi:hypothetical protein